jgi:hypothetical protein
MSLVICCLLTEILEKLRFVGMIVLTLYSNDSMSSMSLETFLVRMNRWQTRLDQNRSSLEGSSSPSWPSFATKELISINILSAS